MIIVSPSPSAFPTGFFIGFERISYTFVEPELFQTPIMEVALVTSRVPEQRFVTDIATLPGSATPDVGEGGDYEFASVSVIFDAGVTRQTVPFTLNPDTITEGTEVFTFRATRSVDSPAYDCVSPCISLIAIFIQDDDRKYYYLPFQ